MSKHIEEFLTLATGLENLLKKRLGKPIRDRCSFESLIDEYAKKNTTWEADLDQIHGLREIRNLLTHRRSPTEGYPVEVPQRVVERLRAIHDRLASPLSAGDCFRTAVQVLSPTTPVAEFLRLAYQREYSQFPLVDNNLRFSGLVTQNTVARWLGRQVGLSNLIDLEGTPIRRVLKDEEPARKGSTLHFARLDEPAEEVLTRFSRHPMLEVVLLTDGGVSRPPFLGIVTQWDAARGLQPSPSTSVPAAPGKTGSRSGD